MTDSEFATVDINNAVACLMPVTRQGWGDESHQSAIWAISNNNWPIADGAIDKAIDYLKRAKERLQPLVDRTNLEIGAAVTGIIDKLAEEQPVAASPVLSVAHDQPGPPPGRCPLDAPENASGKSGAVDPFEALLVRISETIQEEQSELCSNAAGAAAAHVLRHWHDTLRDHEPPLTMKDFKNSFLEDICDTRQALFSLWKRLEALLKVVKEDYLMKSGAQSGDGQ